MPMLLLPTMQSRSSFSMPAAAARITNTVASATSTNVPTVSANARHVCAFRDGDAGTFTTNTRGVPPLSTSYAGGGAGAAQHAMFDIMDPRKLDEMLESGGGDGGDGGNRGDGKGRWWRGGGGGDGSGDEGRDFKRRFLISIDTYVWALALFNIAIFATALANATRQLCVGVATRVQSALIALELRGKMTAAATMAMRRS
mmetsp:Transcript_11406/g.25751  ORF Transcript_11406/g.25751 Transcript_11406/m.25751 type:complete len:200 (-) Transcript_11406:850-1449(-)